jgi:hypothetical protein
MQTVQIVVSPVTVTRMIVNFPNGDTLSRKQISDTTGAATFSFLQTASKITKGGAIASVRIEVGSGGTLTSDVYRYHIGFGTIDAVVKPRTASPGDSYTIFVHTWPHRRVLVYLLYPDSHVVNLVGTTGAEGWATFRRRLNQGALVGHDDHIQVIAILNPGPLKDSTTTSLGVTAQGQHRAR